MKLTHFTKLVMFGLACALGTAPAAAQTTTGTMTPVQSPSSNVPGSTTIKLSKSVEFATVAEAAAHCPNSTVVWSSLNKSHSFHTSSSRYFGKTKHGAYVCKSDALAAGFHQAKN